jgi:hypothetical protein
MPGASHEPPWPYCSSSRECLVGGAPALEAEPDQVHPDQADRVERLARVDRLVADRDAPLVDAHLEAPQPVRPRADQLPGLGDLRDLEVLGAQRRAGRVLAAWGVVERLRLVGVPVRVLGEDHRAVERGCADRDRGVTGEHGLIMKNYRSHR